MPSNAPKGQRPKGKGKGKGKSKPANYNFEFDGENLVAVRKDHLFYHPNVEDRKDHENDKIRLDHSIHAKSRSGEFLPPPIDDFDELPFPDWATTKLRQRFKNIMPIQVQAWSAASQGYDIIGIAETGSGKTLAYVLPMLMHVSAQTDLQPGDGPISLVLLPTRNLCHQITETIREWVRYSDDKGLKCLSVDDVDNNWSSDEAERRCNIMVATPGRLLELLDHGRTNLRRATYVVLDEVDELLKERDDKDQTREIVKRMRPDRQVLLFSATGREEMSQMAVDVMKSDDRLTIIIGDTKVAACRNISQRFEIAPHMQKMDLLVKKMESLKDLLSPECKVLIFVNMKEMLKPVLEAIKTQCGITCAESYGDIGRSCQEELDSVLKRFRSVDDECHVLVATQVLGRGLDIPEIQWVLNFDFPWKLVEYIHRIGRTGRGGQNGNAWTLLEEHDLASARDLRDCLKDSDQLVPSFLHEACHNWRQWKDKRQEWLEKQKEAKEATRASSALPTPSRGSAAVGSSQPVEVGRSALNRSVAVGSSQASWGRRFIELRNTRDRGPQYYCTLCEKIVDPMDLPEHSHPEQEFQDNQKDTKCIGLEHHLDPISGRYFWYDPIKDVSKWDVRPPPSLENRSEISSPATNSLQPSIVKQASQTAERHFDERTREHSLYDLESGIATTETLEPRSRTPPMKPTRVSERQYVVPEGQSIVKQGSQNLERHLDEITGRYYLYNPCTRASEWEETKKEQSHPEPPAGKEQPESTKKCSLESRSDITSPVTKTSEPRSRTPPTKPTLVSECQPVAPECQSIVKQASQNLERHLDENTGRYYWYNPLTHVSGWEETKGEQSHPQHVACNEPPIGKEQPESTKICSLERRSDITSPVTKTLEPRSRTPPTKPTLVSECQPVAPEGQSKVKHASQNLERHLDEDTGRYYLYNPLTRAAEWEETKEEQSHTQPVACNEPAASKEQPESTKKRSLERCSGITSPVTKTFEESSRTPPTKPTIVSERHSVAPEGQSMVKQASQKLERHLDEITGRYYWYNPLTCVAEWEVTKGEQSHPQHVACEPTASNSRFENTKQGNLESRSDIVRPAAKEKNLVAQVSRWEVKGNEPHSRMSHHITLPEAHAHKSANFEGDGKSYCQLRDTPHGPQWWCRLCNMRADPATHLTSDIHLQNVNGRPLQNLKLQGRCALTSSPALTKKECFELRDTVSSGPQWWCNLCEEFADPLHVKSERHVRMECQNKRVIDDGLLDPWQNVGRGSPKQPKDKSPADSRECFQVQANDDVRSRHPLPFDCQAPMQKFYDKSRADDSRECFQIKANEFLQRTPPPNACRSPSQKFYELRSPIGMGPQWFCTLCNEFADSAHSTTSGHLKRHKEWFEQVQVESVVDAHNLERHFDEKTGKHFWHHKTLNISRWEAQDNTPPTFATNAA